MRKGRELNRRKQKSGFYEEYIKRPLDMFCSGMALIVLSPVMLVTALLIRINLGSPVFFRQKRAGLYENPFDILKFRTMTDERDREGNLMPDEVRLTKFGKTLHATSLDELPSLINILKGEWKDAVIDVGIKTSFEFV